MKIFPGSAKYADQKPYYIDNKGPCREERNDGKVFHRVEIIIYVYNGVMKFCVKHKKMIYAQLYKHKHQNHTSCKVKDQQMCDGRADQNR